MRINLRKTKPMKRDLVYTTDDWRLRPFDPTRVFAPSPHQNRQFAPPVEKVGLTTRDHLAIGPGRGRRGAGGGAEAAEPARRLLDDFVGDGEQRRRDVDGEQPGSLQVDDELELG